MKNVLSEIIAHKKKEVASLKRRFSLAEISQQAKQFSITRRSFKKALQQKPVSVIAEIKLKSPSLGTLTSADFSSIAKLYAKSDANAVSVLTDTTYFGGSLSYLTKVRTLCPQPLLRKDFIIDPYQVYESVLAGADAILLIAAVLPPKKLQSLIVLTHSCGLDALVEVHSRSELQKALRAGASIIGINNRNLKTLKIDLAKTHTLMRFVPKKSSLTFVSESGISTREDILAVTKSGVHAILVGSSVVTARNPKAKIKELALR